MSDWKVPASTVMSMKEELRQDDVDTRNAADTEAEVARDLGIV